MTKWSETYLLETRRNDIIWRKLARDFEQAGNGADSAHAYFISGWGAEQLAAKGIRAFENGRYDETLDWTGQALNINSTLAVAWYLKGRAFDQMEQWEMAWDAYQQVLVVEDTRGLPLQGIATVYYSLGRLAYYKLEPRDQEAAWIYLTKAVELGLPSTLKIYAHVLKAEILFARGEDDQAQLEYTLALATPTQDYWARIAIADSLVRRGDERAEIILRRAIQINPDYENAHLLLGKFYEMKGQVADAINVYRQALTYFPNGSDELEQRLHAIED